MPWGPGSGRTACARVCRAIWPCLALIALALIALNSTPARAQALTPALFSPEQGSFVAPQDRPLRRTAAEPGDISGDPGSASKPPERGRASRIGQTPRYGQPAASGAAESGFDSLNRKRKPPKYYPAQARPKPPPGPGSPLPISAVQLRPSTPPSQGANKPPIPPAMAGTVPG